MVKRDFFWTLFRKTVPSQIFLSYLVINSRFISFFYPNLFARMEGGSHDFFIYRRNSKTCLRYMRLELQAKLLVSMLWRNYKRSIFEQYLIICYWNWWLCSIRSEIWWSWFRILKKYHLIAWVSILIFW